MFLSCDQKQKQDFDHDSADKNKKKDVVSNVNYK